MFEPFLRLYYRAVPSAYQEKLGKLEQDILNVREKINILRGQDPGRYTSTADERILLDKHTEALVRLQSFKEKYSQEKSVTVR